VDLKLTVFFIHVIFQNRTTNMKNDNKYTILIADDDPDLLDQLKIRLRLKITKFWLFLLTMKQFK